MWGRGGPAPVAGDARIRPRVQPPPGKMELLIEAWISFLECLSSFVRTGQARGGQSGSVSRRILAAWVLAPGLLSSVLITIMVSGNYYFF